MTLAFVDHFGFNNVFKTPIRGIENMVWQGKPQKDECMAINRNKYGNISPCESFCSRNVICPSDVKGKGNDFSQRTGVNR